MCEYICRCIKGEYKGLEFKFIANDMCSYSVDYYLFFKDLRQASDFIIKFFLNSYETERVDLSLKNNAIIIHSPKIEIEKAVI